MRFKCENKSCGYVSRREISLWPFQCFCGRVYQAPDGCEAKPKDKPRQPKESPVQGLTQAEREELFPGESDQSLLGNRIAAMTTALGIPPCGGCGNRKAWLNKAHAWLRGG